MKTGTFIKPGKIEFKKYPMTKLQPENDAILKVVCSSVCESDSWLLCDISKLPQIELRSMKHWALLKKWAKHAVDIQLETLSLHHLHIVVVNVQSV